MVSVTEKAHKMCQVRTGKANVSEPLMTCRNNTDGIETEERRYLGKQPGGDLPTAQAVPGMEVARAWLRLWCETWGSAGINHRGVAKEGVVR